MIDYEKLLRRCMQEWLESEGSVWSANDKDDYAPEGLEPISEEESDVVFKMSEECRAVYHKKYDMIFKD
jgi:hypothetical protein